MIIQSLGNNIVFSFLIRGCRGQVTFTLNPLTLKTRAE